MQDGILRRAALLGTTSFAFLLVFAAAASPALAAPAVPAAPAVRAAAAQLARPAAASPVHNPLLKEVLGGEDDDRAVEAPGLSALCQSYLGQLNQYRDPTPNVDQIVADGVVPIGSQAGCGTAQNETTIAVNPENPANIVAGTNDYRLFNSREQRNDASGYAYTSFNGGRTWRDVQLPHLTYQTGGTGALSYMDSAGDPVLAFGPHNTVYYGNIVFSRATPAAGGTESASGIAVNVSHDGGLRWSEPVIIQLDGVDAAGTPQPSRVFNDKIWLAADHNSGRVYVTWTRFLDTPDGDYLESPIVISSSANYGRTFSPYHRIDPTLDATAGGGLQPYSQGSNPQVGRDGSVYVAYESSECASAACDQPTDRDVTVVATSRDHGATFSRRIDDTDYDFPTDEDLGTETLTGENFRINSYPQLAYAPVTARLAVPWSDDRHGQYAPATGASIRTNGDNIVSTSRGGLRWAPTIAIGTPQDEVFAAVATYGGQIAVSSYTRHYDPAGINLDYGYWSSGPGRPSGLAGASLRRITTQSENPQVQFVASTADGEVVQGVFIGDYSAVGIGTDLRIHPCWTDFRGRPGLTSPNQDAYTQSIPLRH